MHVLSPSTIIAYSVFSNIVKRIYSVFRTLFFFLFRTKVATFCLITSPITAFLADPVIYIVLNRKPYLSWWGSSLREAVSEGITDKTSSSSKQKRVKLVVEMRTGWSQSSPAPHWRTNVEAHDRDHYALMEGRVMTSADDECMTLEREREREREREQCCCKYKLMMMETVAHMRLWYGAVRIYSLSPSAWPWFIGSPTLICTYLWCRAWWLLRHHMIKFLPNCVVKICNVAKTSKYVLLIWV